MSQEPQVDEYLLKAQAGEMLKVVSLRKWQRGPRGIFSSQLADFYKLLIFMVDEAGAIVID